MLRFDFLVPTPREASNPWIALALSAVVLLSLSASPAQADEKPNVLFVAIDDLSDWVGCLGGHPQAHTPHIDRLAMRGMFFYERSLPGADLRTLAGVAFIGALSAHDRRL